MATAYLGLGSNLGGRLAALRSAVHALDGHPQISVDLETGLASVYETSPVGVSSDQPSYLNSAVRIETTLSPGDLLAAVLSIERTLGRTRRERGEARVIDIDLLLYDNVIMDNEYLTLPHPRLHERRFVLEPLCEIAGSHIHPNLHFTIARLAKLLRRKKVKDSVTSHAEAPAWYGLNR